MEQYIVNAPFISINIGARVGMNIAQFKRRKHAVDIVNEATEDKQGVFDVRLPFHFKRGEKFGFNGQIDKRSAHEIIEEKAYNDLSVAEVIADFTRAELIRYKKDNCPKLKIDLKKSNGDIREKIVTFFEPEHGKKQPKKEG